MKVSKRIISATLFLMFTTNLPAQVGKVFLSEGFEGTVSLHTPPANWEAESYSDFWFFQNGGYEGGGYHHPSLAHSGSYNAMFKYSGPATSKFLTPTIDLRGTIKPVLTFWHAQEERAGINDKLKVFYRTSSSSPDWEELENYVNPTSGWVQREIILPDGAKTQYCQIAFEGSSQNISWGVCIDDIKLEEKGTLPRQVQSLSLIQNNSYTPSGSSTNPLGIVCINISGNTGNIPIKSISVEYTGTNINDLNINSSELFYTRDSMFSSQIKLTPTIGNTGNTITFSNINYELQTGDNYIWVCTSIKATAKHNNTADFKLLQNSVNIGDVLFPGGTLDPSSFSTIEESLLFDGFESSTGWQSSSGSCWQMGTQTGTGTGDPDFAYSGQKVLATNLSGNYPASIHPSNPHTITTPSINAKFYQNLHLRFKRWLNFEFFDKTSIQRSVDGGTTWVNIWENSTTIQDQNWKNLSYSINQATRKQNVKIRFSIDTTDLTGLFGGWNIDNFAVTGDSIARDLGISGITAPVTHCGMSSAEPVTVKIKNYGGASVSGPFDVGFSLDNGAHYTKETINSATTINSEQEISYTFNPSTANLSQYGLKQLKFKTFLTGDEDLSNDLYSTNLFVYPTLNYKYQNSFESSNGYWNPSGTNSTWAWGIPAATKIDTASNGTKAWVTNLKGYHANSEVSYLESPCFNFTGSEYPVFSFDYWVNAENGVDGFRLDYSINGGTTWNPVPANSNHTQNWCTGTTVTALGTDGWTGITSSGYVTVKTLLPTNVNGVNGVKFRFYFASDAANNYEGVAIDNIKIYELPYDVGVESLTSPITGCLIGGGINPVNLIASVKNFGYRPLKVGLKVPIEIKLRNESVVKDTLAIASIVNQNGSASFTSKNTYSIITKGFHALRINTNFATELSRTNDTLKTTLEVRGIPGYTLGADKAVPNLPPISVSLDGKLNGAVPFNSYAWSAVPTITYPTPTLTPPTNVRTVTATDFGVYAIVVTNENGCEAKDTINVVPSSYDVQITPPAIGISDNCTYPTSVTPQITIQNNGPGNIPAGYHIPLSITVDGVTKVSEDFVLGSPINNGTSTSYTFATCINISIPGTYNINIFSSVNDDENKNNDTLKTTTHVWGLPDVNILQVQDTIVNLNASTITLDAGAGFATYKWQDNSTNQTFAITSNTSAWYKVTVTDSHSCGSDKDSVYVNAKDLSILSIDSPTLSYCDNENAHVKILLSNTGRDAINEVVHATYITPNEAVDQDFTVSLAAGASISKTFDNVVNLPAGEGFIRVTANVTNDPTLNNNTIERSFEKRIAPTVSFNPSTLVKVFDGVQNTISPVYSSDVKSYMWKDPSWSNLSTDSLFTISGTPPGRTLNVVAYSELTQGGCSDTATLSIIADDIAISTIKSPVSRCALVDNTPVIITITNKGNFTYPQNTEFVIGLNVDGVTYSNQTITLTADLTPNSTKDITLTPILNLAGHSSSTIQVTISTTLDAVASNNLLTKTVYSTGNPVVNLGLDRVVHALSETLKAGKNYETYTWYYNSAVTAITDSNYVVASTNGGKYKVTVTDYYGCTGTSNEVTITFAFDDASLDSLYNPASGCGLTASESVKVRVVNNGDVAIPNGKTLTIGFKQYKLPNTIITTGTQDFTLSSEIPVGETRLFDLTSKMSFPENIEYSVKAWVKMVGDMDTSKDTLATTVEAYPPVLFNFPDTIKVTGIDTTLTAPDQGGTTTYQWKSFTTQWNSVTSNQQITISSGGRYMVEVTNPNGCSASDTFYVVGPIEVKSIVAPVNACILSNAETVTVRLKNTGKKTIPSGTIPLVLKVNSTTLATENLPITTPLLPWTTVEYTFTYKPDLSAIGDHQIEVTTAMTGSMNDTLAQTVTAYGNPTPNLGADRNITIPTPLDAGDYASYLWNTGATSRTITVSTTGTYSVTVTDIHGCQGYDEVTLTWLNNTDIRVTQLISPTTNCYDTQGQIVTAQLSNLGAKTFSSGESINISYQIGTGTSVVETYTFTESFAYGNNKNFTFNQKAIVNTGIYTMTLKTIINSVDGQSSSYPFTINTKPALDLGPDTVRVDDIANHPYRINSNISNVSYNWTKAGSSTTLGTEASILVSAYAKYFLTVTNGIGCNAKDSVVVTSLTDVQQISGTDTKVYLFPNPVSEELNIRIESENVDSYTVELISPLGQIVNNLRTEPTANFFDKINVNGLTPGVYLIKVSNAKGSAVFKVIVQKR